MTTTPRSADGRRLVERRGYPHAPGAQLSASLVKKRTASGIACDCGAPSPPPGTAQGAPARPVDRPSPAVDAALGYVAQSPSPLMLAPLRGPAGTRGATQPAGHDRRTSQLAAAPRGPRPRDVFDAPEVEGPRQDHRRPSPMMPRAHLAAAVPSRLHLRRCRGVWCPIFAPPGASATSMPRPSPWARPGSMHGLRT